MSGSTTVYTNFVVASGATLTVSSGSVSEDALVVAGGTMEVAGVASATVLLGGSLGSAVEIISSGGTEVQVTAAHAELELNSGGTIGSTILLTNTVATVASGAVVEDIVISSSIVAIFNAVQPGHLDLEGGTATFTNVVLPQEVISNGELEVFSGTIASGIQVDAGGKLYVSAASVSGTIVRGAGSGATGSGATEVILADSGSSPGDTGFCITDGGQQILFPETVVTDGTLFNGGMQSLMSGATASSMVIDAGGIQILSSGATAVNDHLLSGGSVVDNGTLAFTSGTVVSGVLSGSGLVLESGTGSVSFASGTLSGFSGTVEIDGGSISLASTNDAAHTVFDFESGIKGALIVRGTGSATLAVSGFTTGDRLVLSGLGSGTTLQLSGGNVLMLESAGQVIETISLGSGLDFSQAGLSLSQSGSVGTITVATSAEPAVTTILSGATTVSSGVTALVASGTTVNGLVVQGGTVVVDGRAIQDEVLGGLEIVRSGGSTVQTILTQSGAVQHVTTGGSAIGTIISGGEQDVTGGSALEAVVTGVAANFGALLEAGVQVIGSGGAAIDTTVTVGSTPSYILWGSYTNGYEYVLSGGETLQTTLRGAATMTQHSLQNVLVSGTAYEIVSAGGTAVSTTIDTAGVMEILSGGTADNATLAGGTLILEAGASYGGTVDFVTETAGTYSAAGVAGTPVFGQSVLSATAAQLANITINGFAQFGQVTNGPTGEARNIVITDMSFVSAGSATLGTDNLLTVTEGGNSVTLHVDGAFGSEFYFTRAADGSTEVAYGVPCYCPGTMILTDQGERPVEALAEGDLVITASGEARPIRWIGQRAYDGLFAQGNPDIMPVTIRKGALGGGLPHRDLTISPLHAMAMDGMLVPAILLVNGISITQAHHAACVEYIHVELDTHDLLLAEGAASESFLDDANRGMFHNHAAFMERYPHAKPAEPRYCLPRIEEGPRIERLRARLAA